MKRFVIMFAAVANLVFVDALVKEVAAHTLKGSAAIAVIPGFFNLAYVENRGCAWGMLQGRVWPLVGFGVVALALVIWKRRSIFGAAYLAPILIYAGIIGNLIDRAFRGYVIDMFDFHWGFHHFPCFNVADACLCVAVGLMLLAGLGKGSVK